ncbi:MAG TPA: DnaA/Hda family protein [Pedomonas sp.]|nr:DnaA/Hda family protein [Pedomonas sp.]
MKQPPLPLSYRKATGIENFAVSPSNELAVAYLDNWPDWPSHALLIVGPEKSGKSHLGAIFAGRTGGRVLGPGQLHSRLRLPTMVIDAVGEGVDEEGLFHLINWTREQQIGLVLLSRQPMRQWNLRLPDLISRVQALPMAEIHQPDEPLMAALLVKQFRDRGLDVPPDVIDFLMPRLERHYGRIHAVVEAIDLTALEKRRPVTVPLVRQVLADMAPGVSGPEAGPEAGPESGASGG